MAKGNVVSIGVLGSAETSANNTDGTMINMKGEISATNACHNTHSSIYSIFEPADDTCEREETVCLGSTRSSATGRSTIGSSSNSFGRVEFVVGTCSHLIQVPISARSRARPYSR